MVPIDAPKAMYADKGTSWGGKMSRTNSISMAESQLLDWGFKMRRFALTTSGEWSVDDAMWNYFDIPHLNEVHSQADATILFEDDVATTSILRQRIGPFSIGAVISIFGTSSTSLSYVSTVGPYVILVDSEVSSVDETHSQVTTTYRIFGSRIAALGFPLVQKLLTRNYRILMSEDLPMRERRGALRRQGYQFANDGRAQSFRLSRRTGQNNVIPPTHDGFETWTVSMVRLLSQVEAFVGPDDHRGLRMYTSNGNLFFFPRLCMHEGACLDGIRPDRGYVRCPWHGRKEPSIAKIVISESVACTPIGKHHTVEIERDEIRLTYVGAK